jgi:hypothetical protein
VPHELRTPLKISGCVEMPICSGSSATEQAGGFAMGGHNAVPVPAPADEGVVTFDADSAAVRQSVGQDSTVDRNDGVKHLNQPKTMTAARNSKTSRL